MTEPIPALDDNNMPVGAASKPMTDDELFDWLGSIPADPTEPVGRDPDWDEALDTDDLEGWDDPPPDEPDVEDDDVDEPDAAPLDVVWIDAEADDGEA